MERSAPFTLTAERVLDGTGGVSAARAWVTVSDGFIVATGTGNPPEPARDVGDLLLAPGFLDLQVNGHGRCNFAAAEPVEIVAAVDDLRSAGVSGLLVTVCSAPLGDYPRILDRIRAARAARPDTILGVHLEGPFLGGAPGAHPADVVRPVDPDFVDWIVAAEADLVRLVTLAPEADPGHRAIRTLTGAGVRVALGHSTAAYEETLAAVSAGATVATHLFNGMGPLHHRAPGLAGAALTEPALVPTVIADGVHVHPAVLGLVLAARPDAAIVSDAVEAGTTRLPDGTLAGSALTLPEVFPAVLATGTAPARAIRHVTANPARILGITDRGRIAVGARGDLVTVDPTTGRVGAIGG